MELYQHQPMIVTETNALLQESQSVV